jgi:transcriptional regulator with XRE-family HTH domain
MSLNIGERIQRRRLLRGWSIRYAASRAGISHATWSRIERGRQAADNRFILADIAAALDCSPGDLAGVAVPAGDRAARHAHAAVHGIRQALVDVDLGEPPHVPGRPLDEVRRTAALADQLRQACDYAGAARLLPDLLRDAHAANNPRLLCDVAFFASSVLRNLGHPAEAWLGAERCRDAAQATGDPVLLAYAAYARATAASTCGSLDRARSLADGAADELGRDAGPVMLGSLHLVAANASRTGEHLDEAAELAGRTGETTTMGMYFGPTNVGIWRIGIEADTGDPGRAVAVARETNPAIIPAGFRQVFYYAETARALARMRGRDRDAIRLLLTAERVAPQHVHTSPMVRETTRALLERSRRQAGGSELRGLCARLSVSG